MNRLLHPRTLSRIQKQKVSSGGSSGGGGGVKLILGVAAGAVGGNWVYKNYVKGPESSEKNFSKYMPKVPELELPRKKGIQVQHLSKSLIYENSMNIYRPHLTPFSTSFSTLLC